MLFKLFKIAQLLLTKARTLFGWQNANQPASHGSLRIQNCGYRNNNFLRKFAANPPSKSTDRGNYLTSVNTVNLGKSESEIEIDRQTDRQE